MAARYSTARSIRYGHVESAHDAYAESVAIRSAGRAERPSRGTLDLAPHIDKRYDEEALARTPELRTSQLALLLCPNSGTCLMFANVRSLHFDGSHLSVLRADYGAPALERIFTCIERFAAVCIDACCDAT